MSGCKLLLSVLLAVAGATAAVGAAVEIPARTVSSSRQFIVYSPDAVLRNRVTSFAEEVKRSVLAILRESDSWQAPVVMNFTSVGGTPAVPVSLRPFETAEGMTIQIGVQIGDKPAGINLQKQIVRALLLELCYRDRNEIRGGKSYVEAPWWLVDGIVQILRKPQRGVEVGLYQSILEANKVPAIDQFLRIDNDSLGLVAQSVDSAYAMCLVQLLIEQPSGPANLGRLLRHWPDLAADPVAGLIKEFPALGASPTALQKWWTLNVARFAETNRYKGLTAEATDKALLGILKFELAINKAGEKKTFELGEFEKFLKLPASKPALTAAHTAVITLSARANAVFRPVLADYEQILTLLLRNKTRDAARRIAEAEVYRTAVLKRIDAIADYLNWYEATQMGTRSDAFEGFLKAANDLSAEEERARHSDPISRYLDDLEQEF